MSSYFTLWMGDLESYMDETFIKNAFLQMGEPVLHVKLIKNRYTSLPAGYCFVEFGDEPSAQRCMLRLNGKIVPGSSPPKRFKLNHASYGKENLHMPEYSLFVGDLTGEVDDLQLFTAFSSRYPSCKAAKVVLDQNGSSKGYGFVRFADEIDQQRALREMQRYSHLGGKPIRVSFATPKTDTRTTEGPELTLQNPLQTASLEETTTFGIPLQFSNTTGMESLCVPLTAPGTQTASQYEQYYQQYQQYQNYYWPSYSHYYNYAQQYAAAGYPIDPAQLALYGQYTGYEEESYEQLDVEEEHDIPLDISEANREYIYESEELYEELEDSRWQSPDSLQAQIAAVSS